MPGDENRDWPLPRGTVVSGSLRRFRLTKFVCCRLLGKAQVSGFRTLHALPASKQRNCSDSGCGFAWYTSGNCCSRYAKIDDAFPASQRNTQWQVVRVVPPS